MNKSADPSWGPDEQAVWAVVSDLYAAYLDGDRPRLEAHLSAECTFWDPDTAELLTKTDLQRKRAQAPAGPAGRPDPLELATSAAAVRVFGDTAVESHVLRAIFEDSAHNEELRCSSVLRREGDGRWRFVHHHEERRP